MPNYDMHEDAEQERLDDLFEAELDRAEDERLRDQCVLGDKCCCPHIFHGPDECFTAEWAAEYFGELGGEGG